MKLDARDRLHHPRQLVWDTYRDELPRLAAYLPNIEQIENLSREEPGGGIVKLSNRWVAKGDVPSVAKRFIKPEMLRWDEDVVWDEGRWVCSWRIKPAFFTDHVRVEGETTYRELGGGVTEPHIAGVLAVDVSGVRGVPRLLVGTVNSAVEKLVAKLILPNMQRLNASLGRYLDEPAAG